MQFYEKKTDISVDEIGDYLTKIEDSCIEFTYYDRNKEPNEESVDEFFLSPANDNNKWVSVEQSDLARKYNKMFTLTFIKDFDVDTISAYNLSAILRYIKDNYKGN